jgi:hypothetical protein
VCVYNRTPSFETREEKKNNIFETSCKWRKVFQLKTIPTEENAKLIECIILFFC